MKKPTPFGKYFLLERINVGGMAEVFRAKAFGVEGFERLVAVKRILPNIAEDKEFIRMFIDEAKLSVQLNHANVAQIFDLGVVDGAYYIALEHVHGRDLRGIFDRCRNVGEAMPVAQACFIVMKTCEGLDYAHNKRDQSGRELSLVHRDVSPQNVLVSFEGEVKIIDFGIAKAAGKGSKTQAGILKGKFGYMSPEQVRGLPVDRRSDVFSAGIVLYELLTGERLFVGESDFSTLEKVRNVEILPPSTYNRRIPDELERIVLKALAKDTEDRYQNAIDLHDELQAFVYTAGEFYSRKDLAGWMKKTFGKEIEEETAKLESYRQLKPPAPEPVTLPPRTITGRQTPPPVRKSTQAMGAMGTKPPPPPASRAGAAQSDHHLAAPPPRISQNNLPAQVAPVPSLGSAQPKPGRTDDSGDLAWDDDELETQIYDNPEDDPRNQGKAPGARSTSKPLPLQAPTASSPGLQAHSGPGLHGVAAAAPGAQTAIAPAMDVGPDLSALAGSAVKSWEGPNPNPANTLNGVGGTNGHRNHSGAHKLATGSNQTVAPEPPPPYGAFGAQAPPHNGSGPVMMFDSGNHTASGRMTPAVDAYDPMASFGQGIVQQRGGNKRNLMMIVIGGAVVAAIAVVAVILLTGGDKPVDNVPGTDKGSSGVTQAQPVDPNTGFDLYVVPAGTMQWKLDQESRTDRLPSRIRSIAPGKHTIAIDPPPGFLGQSQQVVVEAGKAHKVEILLEPIPGIKGVWDSVPPGATVSLFTDGKREVLGPSPQTAALDPRHTYAVLFEKQGYVSVNRPIVFSGVQEEKMNVPLEKLTGPVVVEDPNKTKPDPNKTKPDPNKQVGPITKPDPNKTKPDPTKPDPTKPDPNKTKPDPTKPDPTKPDPNKPDPTKPDPTKPDPTKTVAKGTGTLTLGSKPPCEIYVDGASTGLHTPQPKMTLPAGKHRITLINNEFGINEKFVVDIKPDGTEKVIKDFSDRLPK